MPELTPRVVFDCNLFVQGIANRNSPARKALRLFFNGDISLFVSKPIIREVRDVLNRAGLRRKLPGINDRIVNAFLTKLEAKAILLANVPKELSMPEFTEILFTFCQPNWEKVRHTAPTKTGKFESGKGGKTTDETCEMSIELATKKFLTSHQNSLP
jgi:predicted nucleic acid-binding protein